MIKYLVLAWLIQDSLAVLMSDAMLIPDVFLLLLLFYSLSVKETASDVDIFITWAAFFGGLFWDFRWIGIPGLFSLIYVAALLGARWVWGLFPTSGHTIGVFFLVSWGFQLPGFFASLYLWGVGADMFARSLLLYQAYSIPLSAFFSLLFVARKLKNA